MKGSEVACEKKTGSH